MSEVYCLQCKELMPESTGRRKKRYCSDACRMAFNRDTNKLKTEQNSKANKTEQPKPNNLELCRYCGCDLPRLQLPRKYPGACYPCAMKAPPRLPDRDLPLYDCKDRSMTVMERLFYQPADKLRPGEHNFVSLPGRACYGVFPK